MSKVAFIDKMGEKLGVARITIFQWISGRRYISWENLENLMKFTRWEVDAKTLRPELRINYNKKNTCL